MSDRSIRYLRRKEIDIVKWDQCISQAPNGLLYATSVYLDGMTAWDALILDDYDAVMPLTWRKKFGFYYLYQPFFCQQLGIFSKVSPDESLTDSFLINIPSLFSFWDIQLNAANRSRQFKVIPRVNYLLSLNKSYEELQEAYSRSAHRNISKAIADGITATESIQPDDVIRLHRIRFGNTLAINKKEYDKLEVLFSELLSEQRVFFAAARNKNGEIIASSAYLLFRNRLTFLINGNLSESLKNGATHYLKDYVIRKFAQKDIMMDFEGSDIPSFARFYQQFGAREIEHYPAIRNNKLPWPLRFFKNH